jgi:hypothetical protein
MSYCTYETKRNDAFTCVSQSKGMGTWHYTLTINHGKHPSISLLFFFVLSVLSIVLLRLGPPSQSQQQVED